MPSVTELFSCKKHNQLVAVAATIHINVILGMITNVDINNFLGNSIMVMFKNSTVVRVLIKYLKMYLFFLVNIKIISSYFYVIF